MWCACEETKLRDPRISCRGGPQEEGEQAARGPGRQGEKARGEGGAARAATGQGGGGQGRVEAGRAGFAASSGFHGQSSQQLRWLVRPKPDWNDGKREDSELAGRDNSISPWRRNTLSRCMTAANVACAPKLSGTVLLGGQTRRKLVPGGARGLGGGQAICFGCWRGVWSWEGCRASPSLWSTLTSCSGSFLLLGSLPSRALTSTSTFHRLDFSR